MATRHGDAGSDPLTVPDLSGDLKRCPAGQCSIHGRCWTPGQQAKNSCHVCDPQLSPISWAPVPGCVVTLAGDPRFNLYRDGKVIDALFNRPVAVALGPKGELWVSDAFNHKIRRIRGGRVSTQGEIFGAGGLAVDSEGRVFVADSNTHTVIRLDGSLTVHVGGIVPGYRDKKEWAARFSSPRAVAWFAGKLVVADFGNNVVRGVTGTMVSTGSTSPTRATTASAGSTSRTPRTPG